MSKDPRRAQTQEALLNAMVTCLKTQNFNDITTIQLAKTAGISRSSFYTHYKDKYEMIDSYQKELFHKLEYIFDKYENRTDKALQEIFEFLAREQLLSALLSANGTKEIQDYLIHRLKHLIANDFTLPLKTNLKLNPVETEYASVYFAHAVFGICQTWIQNGKKETPQEMTKLLKRFMPSLKIQ